MLLPSSVFSGSVSACGMAICGASASLGRAGAAESETASAAQREMQRGLNITVTGLSFKMYLFYHKTPAL